jgi:hypothetical protein
MFEQLLTMVSEECSAQLEAAAMGGEDSQGLTDSCRAELQQALQSLVSEQGFEMPQEVPEEAPAPAETGSATTTVIVVLVFLALLFTAAGAYVVYIYNERKEFFQEKPQKKLSKQKEMKKRMAESRKAK